MRRDGFGDEHELFRSQVRRFVEREVAPKIAEWNARGTSDRETWRRAGEEGFLGVNAPEAYGGAGTDFRYSAIVMEELAYARAHGMMVSLHSDICMPYLGPVTGAYSDWTPLFDRNRLFDEGLDQNDPWQFKNVIV